MNLRLLIDGIVRQTTVLIAQLATSGGSRSPLAHVAGQVFVELAKELESQGVTKKVSADMFGLALRTYQRRTQRLSQSLTDRGRSLWEAIYDHVARGGMVIRDDILTRFRFDDEASVRGVLRDLVEGGIVFSSGKGRTAVYRLATQDELGKIRSSDDAAGLEALVWSVVFRESPATIERLTVASGLGRAVLESSLASLVSCGRVERAESAGIVRFRAARLVLAVDDPAGWEAGVLDHFSALVKTIGGKLAMDTRASLRDEIGGSTYHLTLYRGHPMEQEVVGELRRFRERFSDLRERVDRHNQEQGLPAHRIKVDAYYGQCVTEDEDEELGDVE